MFGLGMPEIIVICVIALLLFGSSLPTLARSLGKSMVEIKKSVKEVTDDVGIS